VTARFLEIRDELVHRRLQCVGTKEGDVRGTRVDSGRDDGNSGGRCDVKNSG
jgi:hypothetical protein